MKNSRPVWDTEKVRWDTPFLPVLLGSFLCSFVLCTRLYLGCHLSISLSHKGDFVRPGATEKSQNSVWLEQALSNDSEGQARRHPRAVTRAASSGGS